MFPFVPDKVWQAFCRGRDSKPASNREVSGTTPPHRPVGRRVHHGRDVDPQPHHAGQHEQHQLTLISQLCGSITVEENSWNGGH
ncbi:hypothetical protein AAFF_G00166580 [Aldrovandia affinis]|uniref:Uncharacterized protein n=1 Tax=Aldrovandia affinis TaxID=143900 RepID=A0AAD7RM54_9TELE|nr:hypothetical protein AAFF_G00166580 [Aldrovandia affinis]